MIHTEWQEHQREDDIMKATNREEKGAYEVCVCAPASGVFDPIIF